MFIRTRLFKTIIAGALGAVLLTLSVVALWPGGAVADAAPQRQAEMKEAYGRLPMNFEVNRGQADGEVKFLARGRGYQVFLTGNEAVLLLQTADCGLRNRGCAKTSESAGDPQSAIRNLQPAALRLKLRDAQLATRITGGNLLPGKSNYLIGNDPTKWQRDIPNYARVEYREVYPGIALAYYGTQSALEYDFIVQPGADPRRITMTLEGAEQMELADNGDLILQVGGQQLYHRAPLSFQNINGQKRSVKSRYVLRGGNQIGFAVDAYDATQALTIDPIIDFSTFFGGSGSDEGFAIAVDLAGNAYVTGTTYSNNFNTFAPLQTTNRGGKFDAFVTKINGAGTQLVYSTYLGGVGEDAGRGIAVDSQGSAYIAGSTNSPDFNTRNPLQPNITGAAEDAFVARINAQGSELIFSTYLGGSNIDQAFAIAIDGSGAAYVTGSTVSTDFNTRNPLQPTNRGGADVFVAKLTANGAELRYSTYLGGSDFDEAYGIALDAFGNAYIAGGTSSSDFNVLNPLQESNRGGGSDAFVAKINASGSALGFSTYVGGAAVDVAYGIAVDANTNPYITGHTFSTDFNVFNALQENNAGSADAFLVRLNATGAGFIYSTYLGGSEGDFGRGIAIDGNANAYLTGRTLSTDFNTRNPLQANNRGDADAFVAKVNLIGSQLIYSTYLGGARDDLGHGIALDTAGNAYVVGDTRSTDFNTRNPLQANNRGGLDAFVSKLNTNGSQLVYSTYLGGSGEDLGLSIALDTTGNAYISGYTSANDFSTITPIQATSRGGLEIFVTKIFADASNIAYNTYFGGNGSDVGNGIAVDDSGSAYVVGSTTSTNLTTRNPIQPNNRGGLDAFVAKFNPAGSDILYSTYLGGSFSDAGRAIAVDSGGSAFIVGSTFSEDFPAQSAFQPQARGLGDAFIARINPAGTQLNYASYLGGAGGDDANGVAVDAAGSAYVVGRTTSSDFPTRNPIQPSNRGQDDVFVTKVNPDGADLAYSTYLGGQRSDIGNGIAVDSEGNAYLAGSTTSNNFPTQNALQATYGGGDFDGFVAAINATGNILLYATYLGGSRGDVANAIAVDPFKHAYIVGVTASTNFPTRNPLQAENRGGNDVFITKLNPGGASLNYSTYLGGSGDDRAAGVAVNTAGTAYITGATASANFNIQFPLLAYGGGTDVFVAKIISDLSLTLTPQALGLQTNANGTLTVTISAPQSQPVTIALAAASGGIVSLPASVTIPAGATAATFTVTGNTPGTATVTATLPAEQGGATATATVNVVIIAQGPEGDVAPRPNGNGSVTIADWVQTGRFVAGFDTIAPNEFQRADTAPRSTFGNGALTISDWVQTGRYAAGLDPIVPASGPAAPSAGAQIADCGLRIADCQPFSSTNAAFNPASFVFEQTKIRNPQSAIRNQQSRVIRIINASTTRGQQVVVPIELDAQGDENAFGFSLSFDPAQLTFVSAAIGPDVPNAVFNVNSAQVAQGRLGFALSLPTGGVIAAGNNRRVINLVFSIPMSGTATTIPLSFSDQPIAREVANANADALTVVYTAGVVRPVLPLANVSAASFAGQELAAAQIVAAFGTSLATTTQLAASLPLPTNLGGTTVRVTDSRGTTRDAALFFVAPLQVNYQIPPDTAPGTASVAITSGDGALAIGTVNVTTVAPSIFTADASGRGLAAALIVRVNATGEQTTEPISRFDETLGRVVPIPIDLGPEGEQVILIIYGTGLRGRSSLANVGVTIGGVNAEVQFLGQQGGFVGLDQGNIRLPRSLIGRGEVDVVTVVDGKTANTVRVAIKE